MSITHDLAVTDAAVSTLKEYRDNPRQGDVPAIAASLEKVGQFKPIVVNAGTRTGRVNEVLAGNHTLRAAKSLKWATVKAVTVDVDDETAARIVLADNKTADLGGYDESVLANLLTDLPDLSGTGYTFDELDDMLADIREAANDAAASSVPAGEGDAPKYGDDDSGMLNRKSLDEKLGGYTSSDTRSIILSYTGDAYVWMVEKLAGCGEVFDSVSNADTVRRLVEAEVGELAPVVAVPAGGGADGDGAAPDDDADVADGDV